MKTQTKKTLSESSYWLLCKVLVLNFVTDYDELSFDLTPAFNIPSNRIITRSSIPATDDNNNVDVETFIAINGETAAKASVDVVSDPEDAASNNLTDKVTEEKDEGDDSLPVVKETGQ